MKSRPPEGHGDLQHGCEARITVAAKGLIYTLAALTDIAGAQAESSGASCWDARPFPIALQETTVKGREFYQFLPQMK
jgi:hypothetical protein